jgi:hypothetical protein
MRPIENLAKLECMVGRLLSRAKIDIKGHDLRRTFATLVKEASGDEFLAMRLIRDKIPGQSNRHINCPMSQLVEALEHCSPLRLIRQKNRPRGVAGTFWWRRGRVESRLLW